MTSLIPCRACGSILGPWEQIANGCACEGPASPTLRDTFYAVLCAAPSPLPWFDIKRLAEDDHHIRVNDSTTLAVLAVDRRLCWAGRGTYGLYRHGVLPGPRNLEQAARLVLTATGNLHIDGIEFILKQIGYRFSVASLRNALHRSAVISWDGRWWSHPSGEKAMRMLRTDIPVVPSRRKAQFDEIIQNLQHDAAVHLATREQRLGRAPATSGVIGIEWTDG